MADLFDEAVKFVLANEGGFVDHAADPGGATNFGISIRSLRDLERSQISKWDLDKDGDVDAQDMKLITLQQAKDFYRQYFWKDAYNGFNNPVIATKVFDMAVNMGPQQAGKILQRAINWDGSRVVVDGAVGATTVNECNSVGHRMLKQLPSEQAKFYFELVNAKPSRGVFLLGWLRRAYHMPT